MKTITVNINKICIGAIEYKDRNCLSGFIAKGLNIPTYCKDSSGNYIGICETLNITRKELQSIINYNDSCHNFEDSLKNGHEIGSTIWKKNVRKLFKDIGLSVRFVTK